MKLNQGSPMAACVTSDKSPPVTASNMSRPARCDTVRDILVRITCARFSVTMMTVMCSGVLIPYVIGHGYFQRLDFRCARAKY